MVNKIEGNNNLEDFTRGGTLVDPAKDNLDLPLTLPDDGEDKSKKSKQDKKTEVKSVTKEKKEKPKKEEKSKAEKIPTPLEKNETTPKLPYQSVIDDIFADWKKLGDHKDTFDFNLDYDYAEGASGNIIGDRNISLLTSITPVLSHIKDITGEASIKAIEDMIKDEKVDLEALAMLKYFLSKFDGTEDKRKLNSVIGVLDQRVKVIEVAAANLAATEQESKMKEEIDTQDKMVAMLLGLTDVPKNKADLIKYGEHLDAMKGFLADEEKFKGFINKFITETADDKRKTKEVNDAKVATYNTLLGKFTELNTMVATIEEMIYGISVDALLQKVGDMTPEAIAADATCAKTINAIFHMDSDKYKKFVELSTDAAGNVKPASANVLKAYAFMDKSVTSESIGKVTLAKDKIPVRFDLFGLDGKTKLPDVPSIRFGVETKSTDVNGQPITLYPAATIKDMFENKNIPESFGKVFKDMFNPSAVDANGKKLPTFGEAIDKLWKSPLWKGLKKLFLSLGALNGKFAPESKVELDYLNSQTDVKNEREKNKKVYSEKYKVDENINIVDLMDDYKFELELVPADTSTSTASYETPNSRKGEKAFFNALTIEDKIRWLLSDSEKVNIKNGGNSIAYTSIDDGKETEKEGGLTYAKFKTIGVVTQSPPTDPKTPDKLPNVSTPQEKGKPFADNKVQVDALKKDEGYKGDVKMKVEDSGKLHLLVDGTVVGLSINAEKTKATGLYAVLEGGEIMTRNITVTLAVDPTPASIEVSNITLNKDHQNALNGLYHVDVDNGTWDIKGLVAQNNPGFKESFIARALVFPDPTKVIPEMQKLMAGLQRDVFKLDSGTFTFDKLKSVIDTIKASLDKSIEGLSGGTKPTKKDAQGAIDTWYATLTMG